MYKELYKVVHQLDREQKTQIPNLKEILAQSNSFRHSNESVKHRKVFFKLRRKSRLHHIFFIIDLRTKHHSAPKFIIYSGNSVGMINYSLEFTDIHFRSWSQEFLGDLERLLDDKKRTLAHIEYDSFSNILTRAIQCLMTLTARHRSAGRKKIDVDELFHLIKDVSCHIRELIACDRRYVSYVLVADSFVHCSKLFVWEKDVKTYFEEHLPRCKQSSLLLKDLNSNVLAFHRICDIVSEAFREAYMESLEEESMQMKSSRLLQQETVSLTVDADYNDDSITIFDLAENPEETSAITAIHSLSSWNKKGDLSTECTRSTCSMSTSTLPGHSSWTEDSLSQALFLKCFQWYGRMGQPNRQDMKRFIVKAHPEITAQDIDKLPWKSNGRRLDMSLMTLSFRQEDFSFTSHDVDDAIKQ